LTSAWATSSSSQSGMRKCTVTTAPSGSTSGAWTSIPPADTLRTTTVTSPYSSLATTQENNISKRIWMRFSAATPTESARRGRDGAGPEDHSEGRVDFMEIGAKKNNNEYDWAAYKGKLAELRKEAVFDGRKDIEIAAESTPQAKVAYKDIIQAMDIAAQQGFDGVGLSEPSSLSAPPSL
jgi:hypothetical protein